MQIYILHIIILYRNIFYKCRYKNIYNDNIMYIVRTCVRVQWLTWVDVDPKLHTTMIIMHSVLRSLWAGISRMICVFLAENHSPIVLWKPMCSVMANTNCRWNCIGQQFQSSYDHVLASKQAPFGDKTHRHISLLKIRISTFSNYRYSHIESTKHRNLVNTDSLPIQNVCQNTTKMCPTYIPNSIQNSIKFQ